MRTVALLKLKNELKLTADLIRSKRKLFREAVSSLSKTGGNTSIWHNKDLRTLVGQIGKLVWDFRHKHIAFCVLRGKIRDQIEKPSKGNEPDEAQIEKIIAEYMHLIAEETRAITHETLRASAS